MVGSLVVAPPALGRFVVKVIFITKEIFMSGRQEKNCTADGACHMSLEGYEFSADLLNLRSFYNRKAVPGSLRPNH
jgi:hypothetical protein